MVKKMALENGFKQLTLTSVGAETFWKHQGFSAVHESYGVFMRLKIETTFPMGH
jgi:hypothetical protein